MTTAFELIDPPELVGIEHHCIEDIQCNHHSHPFVHFRSHDADYWLLGKMRWRNIMAAGDVLLRLPLGRKPYRATMTGQTRSEPAAFSVSAPRTQQDVLKMTALYSSAFVRRKSLNIDFVREERRRIELVPYAVTRVRPPAGMLSDIHT